MAARYTCVLLMSDEPELTEPAESSARALFDVRHASTHARSERGFPQVAADAVASGGVDFLFNYLAPMIVPGRVLKGVRRQAINFHPAPPAYPGIGSASYALYDGDRMFGATAHRMTMAIDGGEIVRVVRFPIDPDATCATLSYRGRTASLALFHDVCNELSRTGTIGASGDRWEREAVTRAEFERWMILSPADPPDEIERKVRALRHPRLPGPFFEINGERVPVDGVPRA